MIKFPIRDDTNNKKKSISSEALVRMVWVSTFLAMIFTLPALGIFLSIYYGTDNLILGAILGFAVHFVTLAFSSKISKFLIKIIS